MSSDTTPKPMNRRELLFAARTPSTDMASYETPVDEVSVPPADAEVLPTAFEYCIVGCGYKAYVWPYNRAGGTRAA
jgi:Rieske 3Fe-4S